MKIFLFLFVVNKIDREMMIPLTGPFRIVPSPSHF